MLNKIAMLNLMAYGLATVATFVLACLAWRKIRLQRHRYHQDRTGD
jgi:hypothetical protein